MKGTKHEEGKPKPKTNKEMRGKKEDIGDE
jgi:hypothetical protein